MTFSALWDLLSQVKTLELRAESLQPQQPKWSGSAEGRVNLSKINRDTLIFSESGEWNFAEKPRIKFFNIYRWRRLAKDRILELSHLRHGIDSPVHLLNFKKTNASLWRPDKPHICGEDIYAAELLIEKDSIRLKWSIEGPAKNQTVECLYK